jgi:hypothetical protein
VVATCDPARAGRARLERDEPRQLRPEVDLADARDRQGAVGVAERPAPALEAHRAPQLGDRLEPRLVGGQAGPGQRLDAVTTAAA